MAIRSVHREASVKREKFRRTQILLTSEQHRALVEIARREGRSISALVREIVQKELDQRRVNEEDPSARKQRRLDALERIREHREAILRENGGKPLDINVVELINQMREERDAQILAAIVDTSRELAERKQREQNLDQLNSNESNKE